jgi:hypothetical protein
MPPDETSSSLDALSRLADAPSAPMPASFARAVTRRRWVRRARAAAVAALAVAAFAFTTYLASRPSINTAPPHSPRPILAATPTPAPTLAALSRAGLPDDPPTPRVRLPRPMRTEPTLRAFDVARVLREL